MTCTTIQTQRITSESPSVAQNPQGLPGDAIAAPDANVPDSAADMVFLRVRVLEPLRVWSASRYPAWPGGRPASGGPSGAIVRGRRRRISPGVRRTTLRLRRRRV